MADETIKVKMFLYNGPDYWEEESMNSYVSDATGWEDVTQEDYKMLKGWVLKKNAALQKKRDNDRYVIVTQPDWKTSDCIDDYKKIIEHEKKIEEKRKASAKKTAATKLKNKEAKEKKQLAELQAKYGK